MPAITEQARATGRVGGYRPLRISATIPVGFAGHRGESGMRAHVYKSLKRADTYVYLARRDDFACVPAPVLASLGRLQHVLDVELTPERKLAREDAETVRHHLSGRGFHLQFPPSDAQDPMTDDWGTDA